MSNETQSSGASTPQQSTPQQAATGSDSPSLGTCRSAPLPPKAERPLAPHEIHRLAAEDNAKQFKGTTPVFPTNEKPQPKTEAKPEPRPTRLLTAVEIHAQKAKFDKQPLTATVFEVLRNGGKHLPHEVLTIVPSGVMHGASGLPSYEEKMVPVNDKTVAMLIAQSDEQLCLPDELEKLIDIQARMDAWTKRAESATLAGTSDHLNKLREEFNSAVQRGETPDPLPTRDDLQRHRLAEQTAMTAALLKITHDELVPLAKTLLTRFGKMLEEVMRSQEETSREMCQLFSIAHEPSVYWKAAAAVAARYTTRRLPGPHTYESPRGLLAGIINL
jgi:hypothetical protein